MIIISACHVEESDESSECTAKTNLNKMNIKIEILKNENKVLFILGSVVIKTDMTNYYYYYNLLTSW